MNIKVSVICLAYNHENYIRKCLEGFVIQETNFDFEVLVHDDASSDKTTNIIREYEEKYPQIIKPIYQQTNQYSKGVKIIAEILMPLVKGKYVAFCEGDDYWTDKYKIQKQFDALEANLDCYMCVGKVRCVREHGEITKNQYPMIEIDEGLVPADLLIGTYNFHTSCYFCKTEVLRMFYNPDVIFKKWCTGDVALLIFFAQAGGVYFIDEYVSCYRQDSIGSWVDRRTNKSRVEFHKNQIKAWKAYDEFTNFKYHVLLLNAIDRENFKIALFEKKALTILKKDNIQYLKMQKPYYILLAFFPHSMNIVKKLRRKVREIRANILGIKSE